MNWKARIRNPYFWSAIVSTVFLILRLFEVGLPMELEGKIGQAMDAMASVLVALGVFVDPTSKGLTDNE